MNIIEIMRDVIVEQISDTMFYKQYGHNIHLRRLNIKISHITIELSAEYSDIIPSLNVEFLNNNAKIIFINKFMDSFEFLNITLNDNSYKLAYNPNVFQKAKDLITISKEMLQCLSNK